METTGAGTATVGFKELPLKPLPNPETTTGVEWLEAIVEACVLVALSLKLLPKLGAAAETDCAGACGAVAILLLKLLAELGAAGRTIWDEALVGIVEDM
jgi:hypothetical protein